MNRKVILIALVSLSILAAVIANLTLLRPPEEKTPKEKKGVRVIAIAQNLEVPWSLAFAPDGRLFFTERPGRVKVLDSGQVKTIAEFRVAAVGEGGLLGLALDPAFEKNRYVYLYHTYYDSQTQLFNRVVRLTEKDGALVDERIILDHIPASSIHNGGRIRFGPDGKLYVTTGDAAKSALAQDLTSLAGKVLRINPDGTVPKNNPFPNSPVYTYGHRNPQGIDWHPLTGRAYITEHGPSGHDEMNVLEPGKNYGWPDVVGKATDPRFIDPIAETETDTWAPSGASFYTGRRLPGWYGNLFIATLRGSHLRMVVLEPLDYMYVKSTVALYEGVYGRLRDVVEGPDGFLYISTSNRDGRGSPTSDDDRILRVENFEASEASGTSMTRSYAAYQSVVPTLLKLYGSTMIGNNVIAQSRILDQAEKLRRSELSNNYLF